MSAEILFGPFRLNARDGRLVRASRPVPLTPKAFAVLQHLAERPGRLVTKADLLGAVWQDTHVNEGVLKVCVREIRKALGDDARSPSIIETAHRRGYRFIACVGEGAASGVAAGGIPADLAPRAHAPSGGLAGGPARDGTIGAQAALAAIRARRSPEAVRLVGREAELARLSLRFEETLRGERRIVFVTGEPGIGKTATVESFLAVASERPEVLVAGGHCLESYGAGEAYLPVLDALGSLARGPRGEWVASMLRRYAPTWFVQMPALLTDEDRVRLQREILGATKGRMLREICEALEAMTAQVPLVLVIEDLHWSDYSTLDLLAFIARRREPARLFVLGTYRDLELALSGHALEAVKRDLLARGQAEVVPLAFLPEAAIQEYLTGRFPGAAAESRELSRAIHRRTNGNPLFMVNVIDYLASRSLIGGGERGRDLDVSLRELEAVVPEGLRQMILKQRELLTPEERRVLEAASVVGMEFSALAVAAGLDADHEAIEDVCERLSQRGQFLRPAGMRRLPDGTLTGRYAFIHSLYENVLYGQTPIRRRLRLHQRIAEGGVTVFGERVGEIAAELAVHFEQGREFGAAIQHLRQAAENASRRRAYREAVDLLSRARELVRRLPSSERAEERLVILERLGIARRSIGDMQGAASDFRALAARARAGGRREAEARGLLYLASAVSWLDGRRCLAAAEEALRVSRRLDDPLLQAHVRAYSGYWQVLLRGWTAEAVRDGAAAMDAARQAGDLRILSQHVVRHAYYQCLQSDYAAAGETAREGMRLTLQLGEAFDHLLTRFFLGWALLHGGRWGEAVRAADEGAEMARANGHLPKAELFRLQKTWILVEAGSLDQARRQGGESLALSREMGSSVGEQMALAILGMAHAGADRAREALACFDQMDARGRREPIVMGWIWEIHRELAMAEMQLREGSAGAARRHARRALARAAQPGERTCLARARALLSRAALSEGDVPRARGEIEQAIALVDGGGAPLAEWRVHAASAEVRDAMGDAAGAVRARERSSGIREALETSLNGAREGAGSSRGAGSTGLAAPSLQGRPALPLDEPDDGRAPRRRARARA